jgi:hypothetical protein
MGYNEALTELLVAANTIASTLFVNQRTRVISIEMGQRLINALYEFEHLDEVREIAKGARDQQMRELMARVDAIARERAHVPTT